MSDLSQFGLGTEEQDVFIWVLIGYICNTKDSESPVQSLRHTCAVGATMSPWRGAAPLFVPHLVCMREKVRRYYSFTGVCELGPS